MEHQSRSAGSPPGRPLGPPGRRAARRAARERAQQAGQASQNGPNDTPQLEAGQTNDPAAEPKPAPRTESTKVWGFTRKLGTISTAVGHSTASGARGALHRVRKVTHAQGMGDTGLARLIELHAFNAAGDTAFAVGLAGTLFFTVPSQEARGNVALYLILTMAPFAVVAPLIGPFLDRFRRGRRWAIGSTMAIRAFLCWVLAGAVVIDAWWLYPVVLCCLVASKAYGVTRASAVPRLLPSNVPLVTANSRISLAGTAGAGASAAIAGGLSFAGPDWALRWAFVVFVVGTILAIRLPARVDSSEGEENVGLTAVGRTLSGVPTPVVLGLRANASFRAFSGFLLMFMAFLLREHPLPGYPEAVQVGIVAGAAGAGAITGTSLGALARERLKRPEVVIQILVALAGTAAAVSALFYGVVTIALVALSAGLCQQLGKLCLDALIQREVPEQVRTSVFARSETVLQLSWVLGGGLGILLPLIPRLGLSICAVGLAAALVLVLRTGRARRPAGPPKPAAR